MIVTYRTKMSRKEIIEYGRRNQEVLDEWLNEIIQGETNET